MTMRFGHALTTVLLAATLTAGCNGVGSPADKAEANANAGGAEVSRRQATATVGAIKPADVKLIAINLPATEVKPAADNGSGEVTVTSQAFKDGGAIGETYADYGEKVSPPLSWTGVPAGAKSIVILCEDPDAPDPKPYIHWVLYNLPADVNSLRQGIPGQMRLADLGEPEQGKNSSGSIGYFGPRPPKDDPPHHYHFMVFALDRRLDVGPGATRDAVLKAMNGHVLAKGSVTGTYAKASTVPAK